MVRKNSNTSVQSGEPENPAEAVEVEQQTITAPPVEAVASGLAVDLADYRLPQNFEQVAGVQKILTVIPVKRPEKTTFVRVRPSDEHRMLALILELPEEKETYLVSAGLAGELMTTETACRPVQLLTAVTRAGGVFIWPLKLPGTDGRSNPWNESAIEAATKAETRWVRLQANQAIGAYDVYEAVGDLPDPEWPRESFADLLAIAFRGKVIDHADHPVLRRLRGEV